jgi:hypothetical protein
MNQSLHFLILFHLQSLYHYITNASKHYTLQIFNFLLTFVSTIANKIFTNTITITHSVMISKLNLLKGYT